MYTREVAAVNSSGIYVLDKNQICHKVHGGSVVSRLYEIERILPSRSTVHFITPSGEVLVDFKQNLNPGSLELPFKVKTLVVKDHEIYIDVNGNAYSKGRHSRGQLGLGHNNAVSKLTKIENIPTIQAAAIGKEFTLLLSTDGDVYFAGYGGTPTPTKLENIPKIKMIRAGEYHSLLLDENGEVWSLGENDNGQLGIGISFSEQPLKIQDLPSIQSIAAGNEQSFFIDNEFRVWACGKNNYYELGTSNNVEYHIPTRLDFSEEIEFIVSENGHTIFVGVNGSAWQCGHYADFTTPTLIQNLPKIQSSFVGNKFVKSARNSILS